MKNYVARTSLLFYCTKLSQILQVLPDKTKTINNSRETIAALVKRICFQSRRVELISTLQNEKLKNDEKFVHLILQIVF